MSLGTNLDVTIGMSGRAGAGSMSLDFLTTTSLDSRITFSRGTNATLTDSTGRVTFAPNNVVTNSVGPSANTGTTVATVSGAAPDGTNAVRLSKTDATTPRYSNWTTLFTVQANTAYVASAYFKYDGFNTTVSVEYNNGTHFGTTWVATFNVTASGITANSPSNCTSGVQAVGNGWFRVWAAFTSGTPSAPTNPTFLTQITGGTGTSVLVAWGQLEQVTYQTTPSTYVATTASAYYGPRFDYDPVTRAPRGLLIEEQRTNLLLRSEEFDNASWTDAAPSSTVTVAANATAAPDGATTADSLTAATGGTNAMARQVRTLVASTTYTGSVFIKASSSTQSRMLLRDTTAGTNFADATITWTAGVPSIAGGSTGTWTVTSFGNGWYRVTGTGATGATASPLVTFSLWPDTAAGTNAIFIWGAQLEAGAFATSYIPTVASQVTRTADVAAINAPNFASWFNGVEGSLVVEATTTAGNARAATLSAGTVTNQIFVQGGAVGEASLQVYTAGSFVAQIGLLPASATKKIAAAYKANDFAVSIDGGAASTDTSGALGTYDRLNIGARFDGTAGFLNGHIRSIRYYPTRLSNAQLQALSA